MDFCFLVDLVPNHGDTAEEHAKPRDEEVYCPGAGLHFVRDKATYAGSTAVGFDIAVVGVGAKTYRAYHEDAEGNGEGVGNLVGKGKDGKLRALGAFTGFPLLIVDDVAGHDHGEVAVGSVGKAEQELVDENCPKRTHGGASESVQEEGNEADGKSVQTEEDEGLLFAPLFVDDGHEYDGNHTADGASGAYEPAKAVAGELAEPDEREVYALAQKYRGGLDGDAKPYVSTESEHICCKDDEEHFVMLDLLEHLFEAHCARGGGNDVFFVEKVDEQIQYESHAGHDGGKNDVLGFAEALATRQHTDDCGKDSGSGKRYGLGGIGDAGANAAFFAVRGKQCKHALRRYVGKRHADIPSCSDEEYVDVPAGVATEGNVDKRKHGKQGKRERRNQYPGAHFARLEVRAVYEVAYDEVRDDTQQFGAEYDDSHVLEIGAQDVVEKLGLIAVHEPYSELNAHNAERIDNRVFER